MDVKQAEERIRLAASECDALAERVVVSGVPGPPPPEEGPEQRWLAVAAAVIIVIMLGGFLAVQGISGPGGSSPEVRSGPGTSEAGPGWHILDPASLPVKAGAWSVTIEPETSADPAGSDEAGRWCLMTKSKGGSGGSCGTWQDRDSPVVIGSPGMRGYLDPTSELPAPPEGASIMAVAGPSDEQIIIGTGDDAVPLDQIPAADTATARIDGEGWTATAFYVDLDSDRYPEASFARMSGPEGGRTAMGLSCGATPTPAENSGISAPLPDSEAIRAVRGADEGVAVLITNHRHGPVEVTTSSVTIVVLDADGAIVAFGGNGELGLSVLDLDPEESGTARAIVPARSCRARQEPLAPGTYDVAVAFTATTEGGPMALRSPIGQVTFD